MVDLSGEAALENAVDLSYFAVRNYLAAADQILRDLNMSRAHHRVLHFVARNPGGTVKALAEILAVSRQALHGPLKRLIDDGYVTSAPSENDSRQRELRLTASGQVLQEQLNASMLEYLRVAFETAGSEDVVGWMRVMEVMAFPSAPARGRG